MNTLLQPGDVDTSYVNIVRVASDRTDEELLAEREWMARRLELDLLPYKAETRISGDCASSLVLYVLTGCVPKKEPYSTHDMGAVFNMYAMAPPHVKKLLDPIVGPWKAKIYNDPDDPIIVKPDDESPLDISDYYY